MMSKSIIISLVLLVSTAIPERNNAQNSEFLSITDSELSIHQMKWRSVGPPRGGRANAITGVIGNDQIYYAGYTGGGVWKTYDGGDHWENISDGYFTTSSIGDIAVSAQDPNVVYVGSGEHAVRGVMSTYGDGIYKSEDAGQSWKNMGLEKTRHISDIIIHPHDDDILFVGAQGAVHGPSMDRGVFITKDGGATWKKTLYIDEDTGISSLKMDPSNPRILYAATWDHRRLPWKVISGGEGSGIYKSTDSGETWNKLTEGLPTMMGKIGLSVSAANPDRIFALVEAEKEVAGMYRSDDAGKTWTLLTNDQIITARSWYYMEVFADPNNEDVVYALNAPLMKSIDGGKTFTSMRVIHGDCHGFWINPSNSKNIAMAEDGGATISYTGGKTWSTLNNQATAQFYRITADRQIPYWIYSGQQDNLSVAMPSQSKSYGILTRHWYNGPGCESAMVAFDNPEDPRILYGGCFNGRISLLDNKTMEKKDIQPYPATNLGYDAKDMKYRFNWNAPLINSPQDPKTMFYGGNVVFKTTDGGLNWDVISPDLTRNEESKQGRGGGPFTNEGAGGENYNTLYYLAASPHDENVIYTSSDCGKLHITKDGGANWDDITPKGLPETMIHSIEVSPHDPSTVYFASTRYKFNDFSNYSYRSNDYGKTWKKIGNDIQADDFFKVVREDPEVPGILYAGAERGFYISFDNGNTFSKFQINLPIVPITDIVIRDNDLAISTAGRSFWILDDISVLQQSKGRLPKNELSLFEPKSYHRLLGGAPFFLITEDAFGENPPMGIPIDYYVPQVTEDSLTLEILDNSGNVIRSYKGISETIKPKLAGGRGNLEVHNTTELPYAKGLNRFTWDLRTKGLVKIENQFVQGADYRGHRVAPGTFTARMTLGTQISEVQIVLLPPPDIDVPDHIWESQQNMLESIENDINDMHNKLKIAIEMKQRMDQISDQIKPIKDIDDLKEKTRSLQEKIENWNGKIIEMRQKNFQDALNWPAGINSEFFLLKDNLDTYDPNVPGGYQKRYSDLEKTWQTYNRSFDQIMNEDVQSFEELYRSKNLPMLPAIQKKESL